MRVSRIVWWLAGPQLLSYNFVVMSTASGRFLREGDKKVACQGRIASVFSQV